MLEDLESNLKGVSNALGGGAKPAPKPVVAVPGEYQNGEDLQTPPGATATTNAAPGDGGNRVELDRTIEFVHFGFVYKDGGKLFANAELADDAPVDLAAQLGAHGLMMRAALEREAILLAGFGRAKMDAITAEEKSKGVLGDVMGAVSDLLGAAGSKADRPSPSDWEPHVKKVIEVGAKINVDTIDYPVIHKAGIDLHEARSSYRKFLEGELKKRKDDKKSPGGGLLDGIPLLTGLLPPAVADVVSTCQQIGFKAFDVYMALVLEYSVRLEPSIEMACRDITVASIRNRASPAFPVWFVPPQAAPTGPGNLVDKPDGMVGDLLGGAIDSVNDAAKPVMEVVDFLSRPARYTPGSPFLDQAFLVQPSATPPPAGSASTKLSDKLADMAADAFDGALGKPLPDPLRWFVTKISTVTGEFVRAVYGTLLTLMPDDGVSEQELVQAGRSHFVREVFETILGVFSFLDDVRKFAPDFNGMSISVDALIGRAKELVDKEVGPYLDPVVEFAMRDLYKAIRAPWATARMNKGVTMEIYLAQLPSVLARLFRNVFFPIWDLLMEKGLSALTNALLPASTAAAGALATAKNQVDNVREVMLKTNKMIDAVKDANFSLEKGEKNLDPFTDALGAKLPADQAPPDPLASTFPVPSRKTKGTSNAITAAQCDEVQPDLKWKEPDAAPAADTRSTAA